MANLAVIVPYTKKSFWTLEESKGISAQMDMIKSKYGAFVNQSARLSNVLPEIIISTIAIESAGDKNAVSASGARGLMQLIPSSANDILIMENVKQRLTDGEKAVLRKRMGSRLDQLLKMKYLGDPKANAGKINFVTAADLSDPEFNIQVGTIFLGLLIDEEKEGGTTRLDRVVVRYNKGYFSKMDRSKTVEQNLATAKAETKAYILKMGGLNGTMDLLT
jgi:soluble lytic murein transglycosylase-like protein